MTNYLNNGSFEDGWYHPNNVPELQIPEGWLFWFADENTPNPIDPPAHSEFVRPEVRVFPRIDLPEHEKDLFVLDGAYCLKMFKDGGSWAVSLSQTLDLAPGRYRLTVKIFADLVKEYLDDGTKDWADDPNHNDGLVRLVVDDTPFGWDPFLSTQWTSLIPGAWNDIDAEFYTEGEITLWVDFMCPFPLDNAGIFADAWTLEMIEEPIPDPEPTPTRGAPRVQYARKYNVIHPRATREEAHKIFDKAYDKRETVGWSYDDAGVGDLGDKTANLEGIAHVVRPDFVGWFDEHYTDTKVTFEPLVDEDPPAPAPPFNEFLTLHMQNPVPGWEEFVERVQPEYMKVFQFELARVVKGLSPNTKVIVRHYITQGEQGRYMAYAGGVDFLGLFLDSLKANAEWVDVVEGLNETVATHDLDGIRKAVAFAVDFSDEVAFHNLGVATCLLNVPVGNPDHGSEVELLLPAAEAAVRNDGYLGYHPYFPANPRLDIAEEWMENEGYHHHMRALWSWDETFAAHGLAPRYLFTEVGAIGASVREDGRPGGYNAAAGWRSNFCLNGDWNRNLALLLRWREGVAEWNTTHNNRAEAATLFTSGIGIGWEEFLYEQEQFESMAVALKGV